MKKVLNYLPFVIGALILGGVALYFSGTNKAQNGTDGGKNQTSKTLKLVKYETNEFSIDLPEGWKISTTGQYETFGFRAVDPNNESFQIFFYSKMEPFIKNMEAKNLFQNNANIVTGVYKTMYQQTADAPVLQTKTADYFYFVFNEFAAYANKYGINHEFNRFDDLEISIVEGYSTPLAPYMTSEGLVKIDFINASGNKTEGLFAASIDANYELYVTNIDCGVATVRNILGISSPEGQFENYKDILIQSLNSFTFSDEYVKEGNKRINENGKTVIENIKNWSGIMDSINKSWDDYIRN